MRISSRNYTTLIFVLSILLLGLFLRRYNFTDYPRLGATHDEFAWTWLGINIIQEHEPSSWSPHPHYESRYHLKHNGANYWIVKPYLEHPPLFGLVAGGSALLLGAGNMLGANLAHMRPLSIILGGSSIILLFLLTKEIYNNKTALFAALLYATVPTIVIGSRLLQNENFFIPLFLLSLLMTAKYLKTKSKKLLNLILLLLFLLPLAKIPWIAAGASVASILLFYKQYKSTIYVLTATSLGVFAYILYGLLIDAELFLGLMSLQTARYDISFTTLHSFFSDPLLADRTYLDGWIYFGYFSIFLLAKDFKKNLFILLPFFIYLSMFLFAIPNEPSHGWYRYPMYPFLLTSVAIVFINELRNPSFISYLAVLIIGLATLSNFYEELFGFSIVAYRIFLLLSASTLLLPILLKKYDMMNKVFLPLWIVTLILFNIMSVLAYIE